MKSINHISDQALLVILDGFGINPNTNKNAIRDAKKPHLDKLFATYPFTTILAGGIEVGLPKGVAGNSEVGHLNLGAGRPVRQDLVRINEAIANNTLKDMPKLQELIQIALSGNKRIHVMGLLSDGGVHSHIEHLKQLLKIFKQYPALKIYLHAFMDGRDTKQENGINYVRDIESYGGFTFASMQGRSIGMDRDRRWNKIEDCYKTLIGAGATTTLTPADYVLKQYESKKFDEFIEPVLFSQEGKLQNDDAFFFFNFRPDRAKQISLALTDPKFTEFKVPVKPHYYLCMTPYIPDEVTLPIVFDKEKIPGTLAEYLSKLNKKQFKIAETEKYAHVTYFFNGGEEKSFPGEERVLVPSPREVATYDQKPEMSAPIVTEKLLEALKNKDITFFAVNFANSDMVGHTGNYSAAVRAIEALDSAVFKLSEFCLTHDIPMIITADHGNSDQMVYEDGSPHTSHTEAPVPFCVVAKGFENSGLTTTANIYALKDVAPTILHILGISMPAEFSGTTIFE